MARAKLNFGWIANPRARKTAYKKRMLGLMKKARELTILCNMRACLIFFSRDDNKLVAWPSHKEAKSLTHRYFSLPDLERNMKAEDQESFIKNNTKKIEKKLADSRKVIAEFEMDHLMFRLQTGRRLVDLSQTEIGKLITYSEKKIKCFSRELGHPYASVNEPFVADETPTPRASLDAFITMGSGSVYYMDKWVFDDPKVLINGNHDQTHLSPTVPRFNLNLEPSDDDDEDMEIYKGECSKSGGADDA